MRVLTAIVYEVGHIGKLAPSPDVKILEDLFPKRTRREAGGRWACGQGEVDVLLAVDSLHKFPKSETQKRWFGSPAQPDLQKLPGHGTGSEAVAKDSL